ncbi:MAG: TM2 domain-containing protein [Elioraea sp.]|nr:TM2 domain-containing protein [Elioraea sp.]
MRFESRKRSTGAAYLLWFFLGGFGAHRFYLGRSASAVAMLLLFIISIPLLFVFVGWFGLIIFSIWWLVDAFLIPGMIRRYNMALIGELAVPAAGSATS